MVLVLGESLFDVFPASNSRRFGGAPFNFACHLQRFGYPVTLVSRVGADSDGQEILDILGRYNFDLSFIQVDPLHATGQAIVSLDSQGVASYNFPENSAYDHLHLDDMPFPDAQPLELVYLGSLLQRSDAARAQVQRLLARLPRKTRIFYDVNLRAGCDRREIVEGTLRYAQVLKINDAELGWIGARFYPEASEQNCIAGLFDNFPAMRLIMVTRGEHGSHLFTRQGEEAHAPAHSITLADTVGAGDAFSAAAVIGLLKGWDIATINTRAAAFSAAICGIAGAIPADASFYWQQAFAHFRRLG